MDSFIITALQQYGYVALWLIVFIAAVGAPISGNLLLYAAGAFAAFGDFNIFLLLPIAVSAAVMGDNLGYVIGWKVGTPIFAWFEKKKRWRIVSPEAVARGRSYFRKHAAWAIFISRWLIVVLGGPINWLAGAERYSYRKFLFWDVCGQLLGAIIPLSIGYIFAASWREAESLVGAISAFALTFLVTLIVAGVLIRNIRAHKRASAHAQRNAAQNLILPHEMLSALNEESLSTAMHAQPESTEIAQTTRSTILILISRSGGGHLNLAQALRDKLGTRYNVRIVDPQAALVERGYTLVSQRFVRLLTWQFALTDNKIAAWLLQKALALSSYKRFQRVLEEIQPDLIITTHALVSSAAALANETSRRPVPLVFQLTDLNSLHMTWFVEKHADAYLAPTQEIFAQALEQGIARERLYLTGRPARRQFYEQTSSTKETTLTALGFDPTKLTIFLQGGAQGSASVDRLITSILADKLPIQVILAAGKHKKLAERYAGIEQVRVLPFTETIAPYMAAADMIVGKAGASSITEAFLLEKPFLVTTLIPGQETPNLRFIERHNLGWVCLRPDAQSELLAQLANNPDLIAEKISSIQTYKAWNIQANQTIEPLIEQLLTTKGRSAFAVEPILTVTNRYA